MRIFLTGGTGFIGSHFLNLALRFGDRVTALRRTSNSRTAIPLTQEPDWVDGSLGELTTNDFNGCQAVVHFASAGVSPKQVPWNDLVEANVVGTANLICLAHEAGIRRVVVAGTCHEYGISALDYEAIPPNAPLQPANLYGASKAAAYQLVSGFARVHRLELFYGRIFSAYGEGQSDQNFWPSMRRAALAGNDFEMTSGVQIRDFMPVGLVASKFLKACHRVDILPGEPCTENIGTGHPTSLLSFAQAQWKIFGATGKLLPGTRNDRPDDIQRFVPLLPADHPPS